MPRQTKPLETTSAQNDYILYIKTPRKRWETRRSGDYISLPYTVNNNLNSAEPKQLTICK